MRANLLNNKKGFSLIELMVVVAIIAILASFAIPQYQSFQAKARQKEGQTLLSGYFTSVAATQAESGLLPMNFVAVGFNPAGQVHYRILTVNGVAVASGPTDTTCISTLNNCNNYRAWNEFTTVGAFYANNANNCNTTGNINNGTWRACGSANIRASSGADVDTWSINERKTIANTNDGIN